jgi:hypothetical protein
MAALAGIAVGLVIVRVGVHETAASRAYVEQPEYAVWAGLTLLTFSVGAVLGVVSLYWAIEIRAQPPNDDFPRWQVVVAGLGVAIALVAVLQAQGAAMALDYPRSYPDAQHLRVIGFVVLAAPFVAVPTVALWGLSRAAAAIDAAADNAIERFSWLWSRQRQLLGVLSTQLTLSMLTTAAKFQAKNSFTPPDGPPLPEATTTFLLVVGAGYGAILVAIYLPPHYATRRSGEALSRALCPMPSGKSPETQLATHEKRKRYQAALGLDESTRQHLERNAVLLAPLLTALVTALLPDIRT